MFPDGIFPQYNHPAGGKNLIQEILQADLFAPVIEMQQRGDICRFLQFRSNWK